MPEEENKSSFKDLLEELADFSTQQGEDDTEAQFNKIVNSLEKLKAFTPEVQELCEEYILQQENEVENLENCINNITKEEVAIEASRVKFKVEEPELKEKLKCISREKSMKEEVVKDLEKKILEEKKLLSSLDKKTDELEKELHRVSAEVQENTNKLEEINIQKAKISSSIITITQDISKIKAQKGRILQRRNQLQQFHNKNFMYWDHEMIVSFILRAHPKGNEPNVIEEITQGVKEAFCDGEDLKIIEDADLQHTLKVKNARYRKKIRDSIRYLVEHGVTPGEA